jgi:UDP:flavonoid glycosyltransferase YjiC (YdhE family)
LRVLITAVAPSHLLPMVPLAWAACAAGHQVLVAGGPGVTGAAAGAGLHAYTVGKDPVAEPVTGGPAQARDFGPRWRDRVGGVLGDYLALARGWRPDLVVTDPMEFSAFIVGGVLGRPVVTHRWGPDALTTVARPAAAEALASICAGAGLAGGLPEPALTLDPCPPGLQSPLAGAAEHIRFVPYNGAGTGSPALPERAGSRRVCVTLGIFGGQLLAHHGTTMLHSIMRAVDGLPETEAVLTVRPELREQLPPVPPSVRLVDPTPLDELLPQCDAVVHHGGTGTALTAVAHGVPPLVLTQSHPAYATTGERVQAAGAGRTIADPATQADPAAVRRALAAVLDEPAYREGTGTLRGQMHALPLPAAVVSTLEQMVRRG